MEGRDEGEGRIGSIRREGGRRRGGKEGGKGSM